MKLSKRNLVKRITLLVAAGSLAVTGQTWAAEPEYQLDQVTVTATRVAQPVTAVAADVTVITAEQIEAKGAKTLADALDGVPGVLVSRRGGAGDNAIPYILGSERVVVLMDGKRLNLPQGVGRGASNVDINNILIAGNIEKIEVVRGGGSALYGADAIGGVINIVTRQGSGPNKTTVTTEYGTYNSKLWSLANQGSDNGFHWFITAMQDKSEGHRTNSDIDSKNATLRLDKDLSDKESLSLTYEYLESAGGNPGTIDGSWWPGRNDYLKNSYSFAYNKKHGQGTQIVRFYDNQQDRTYVTGGTTYHYLNKVKALEYQDSLQINARNYLTWGAEWRKEQVVTNDYIGNTSPEQTNKAVFVQNQYSFNDQTSATLGVRYDNNSTYGSNLLPKVGLSHQADKNTTYFASWGKVFKAPKFDDLYTPVDPVWGGGDPNLKPETGWTGELGVKKKLDSRSEATVSLFRRELNDAIDWVFVPPVKYEVQNIHRLSTTGITVSYGTKLTSAVSMNVGYSYMDSRDENRAQKAPYHTFHAGFSLKSGKFNQTLQARYMSEYTVSGRVVADTMMNYAFTADKSAYVKISNIFDKQYQDVVGYPAPGRMITIGLKQTF